MLRLLGKQGPRGSSRVLLEHLGFWILTFGFESLGFWEFGGGKGGGHRVS